MAQNLVRGVGSRNNHEPSDMLESLWGKIDPKSIGDQVYRGRPSELNGKLNKFKKKKERDRIQASLHISPKQKGPPL